MPALERQVDRAAKEGDVRTLLLLLIHREGTDAFQERICHVLDQMGHDGVRAVMDCMDEAAEELRSQERTPRIVRNRAKQLRGDTSWLDEPVDEAEVVLLGGVKAFEHMSADGVSVAIAEVNSGNHSRKACRWAVSGLGSGDRPEVFDALVEWMGRDGNGPYAEPAAWALGTTGDPRAVPPLLEALNSRSVRVVEVSTHALMELGGLSQGLLEDFVYEKDSAPRKKRAVAAAARGLAASGDFRTLRVLTGCLPTKSDLVYGLVMLR